MIDIPHDIWLHIAQFIPLLVLRNMFSLNRTFFDIVMDLRYQQVSFAYLNTRMIRTLVRLKYVILDIAVLVEYYPQSFSEILQLRSAFAFSTSTRTLLNKFLKKKLHFPHGVPSPYAGNSRTLPAVFAT
jgi:hypothetical protein